MTVSVEDVRRRLPDAELTEVSLPEDAAATWVVELSPDDDLVGAWTAIRDAVADLGLHPVAVTDWGNDGWPAADLFSRFYYGEGAGSGPSQVLARAHELSVDAARDWFRRRSPSPEHDAWDEFVGVELDLTQQAVGARPDDDVWADVRHGDAVGLERRLLGWEQDRRPTETPAPSTTFSWFDPVGLRTGLVLLPVTTPSDSLAFLSFFGAEGPGGHEALVRLLRDWERRFGAELVANWGTMLQFVVARPPAELDEAFDLAAELVMVAPCTTALTGESTRHLARHLWRGDRWFLHERP